MDCNPEVWRGRASAIPSPIGRRWPRSGRMRVGRRSRREPSRRSGRRGWRERTTLTLSRKAARCALGRSSPLPRGEGRPKLDPSPIDRRWPRSGRMRVGRRSRREPSQGFGRRGWRGRTTFTLSRKAARYALGRSSPLPMGEGGHRPSVFARSRMAASMRPGSARASALVKRMTVQPSASIACWR